MKVWVIRNKKGEFSDGKALPRFWDDFDRHGKLFLTLGKINTHLKAVERDYERRRIVHYKNTGNHLPHPYEDAELVEFKLDVTRLEKLNPHGYS